MARPLINKARSFMKSRDIIRTILFPVLLLGLVSGAYGATMDRIVAIVNNEIITMSEVEEDLLPVRFRSEERYAGTEVNLTADLLLRERLKMMIDKRLELQIAKKTGVSVSQEEIKAAIEDIKKKNSIKSDKEFTRVLEDEHITFEKYTADIKDQLMLTKLINREVRNKIVIRDEELQDYYDKHKYLFALPPEIKISQILIPIPKGVSDDVIEDLRGMAKGLVEEIRAGADFFDSAKKYIVKINGLSVADLGFFRKGDLVPSLEEAALSLKVGEVSNPVNTEAGIHIIRLDEKGSRYKSYKEVTREIEDDVYQEKYNEVFVRWLKDIRDNAHIEVRF